jgi:hypothetical protein
MEYDKEELMDSNVFWVVVIMFKVTCAIKSTGNKSKIDNEYHPGTKGINANGYLSKYLIAGKYEREGRAIQRI